MAGRTTHVTLERFIGYQGTSERTRGDDCDGDQREGCAITCGTADAAAGERSLEEWRPDDSHVQSQQGHPTHDPDPPAVTDR